MSDEEKEKFLQDLDKKVVWEMGEGKPRQDISSPLDEDGKLQPLLVKIIGEDEKE